MAKPKRSKTMTLFAERLKTARAAKYRSAEAFADFMGIHPHRYRKYERGETQPPLELLRRMCAALDVSIEYLVPTEHKAA